MKDIIYAILIVLFALCVGGFIQSSIYDRLIRDIAKNSEIRLYDEIYTCKLKGTWKSENVFIPAKVKE